ncbi:hypothetical protein OAT44_08265 [Alphaproteobacteria bacterium]|nr:hypothetical protein [Alphaproteobacteria bacterium]
MSRFELIMFGLFIMFLPTILYWVTNIKTNVIDRKNYPYLGVGEVVAGPTGAAISNALHEAIGQRIKKMPFTKENITKELLN